MNPFGSLQPGRIDSRAVWRVSGPTNQSIIACMGGKEFALADVINMEKAIIPFFSKLSRWRRLCHHVPALKEDERVRGGGQGDNGWKKLLLFHELIRLQIVSD